MSGKFDLINANLPKNTLTAFCDVDFETIKLKLLVSMLLAGPGIYLDGVVPQKINPANTNCARNLVRQKSISQIQDFVEEPTVEFGGIIDGEVCVLMEDEIIVKQHTCGDNDTLDCDCNTHFRYRQKFDIRFDRAGNPRFERPEQKVYEWLP